ncbi:prolyl-tRNA synthetase [Drechmeria coniospora]|uniref:proline--tRNA ligase n=1 Tax=Drechmeria coniospora TaxID=98403 RepID=A0A151GPY3_DRECN|nr:prolyl-tRNA synthetase [Drechmeria coniospora]KYK59169.1 prolyl-tRNA synthetase [Drechmeria coniospora]
MEGAAEPSKSALKKAEKQAKLAAEKAAKAAKKATLPVVGGKKTEDIIGITVSKSENFPAWYQEVVLKADMVEYYQEISGFFVLRPLAMHIWTVIRKWFSENIEELGVDEVSFPLFLSSKSLEKEKDHVDGFAPELAWVTKAYVSSSPPAPPDCRWTSFSPSPSAAATRTSKSPWRSTTPFLRTREFLWQEGHTAHLTEKLAGEEVLQILELYAGVYEQLLALPVVRGRKTENEKFAGGYYTTTVEGYVPANGRGIQGATSHCLGQNFSKMFDITVEDPSNKGTHMHVWQNSWGLSTRVIGVMVMVHGDDKGLVLPPRVAKVQAILIPVGINKSTTAEDRKKHEDQMDEIKQTLRKAGVRSDTDWREGYTPAWKFNDWELKGVPLRIEFGPKDASKEVISWARRDTGEKGTFPIAEVGTKVPELLETIQKDMYTKAEASFREHRRKITSWDDVLPALDDKNVVLIPFCLDGKCEDRMKELTTRVDDQRDVPENQKLPSMGMKSLCIPFEQPEGSELVPGETACLNPECKGKAQKWVMFGRSY